MEYSLQQHEDDPSPDIRAHRTEVNSPGRTYKILYTLREAAILGWSFAARGPCLRARRATRGRLPTRTHPVWEGACGLEADEGDRSWCMRDQNSRGGRASRSVRRQVSGSRVRAPRVREEVTKDAEAQRVDSASALARSRRAPRKSKRIADVPSREDARVTPSSGNVFLDIGFPPGEAEHLLVRSHLMMAIEQL